MCTLKTIIEVLSSLTPIFIGLAVVYIAWQQHKTNKHRLKMELFDRRYKVYDAVIVAITKNFDEINYDMYYILHRDVSSARFLFTSKDKELDKKLLAFILKVVSAVHDIVKLRTEEDIPDLTFSQLSDTEEGRQEANDLCENLMTLRKEAIDVFSKYLTLEA